MIDQPIHQDLLETLKTALRMEAEGKKLFGEAARKATGRHARQTFEFLVAEEDKHIEQIRRVFTEVEVSGVVEARITPDSGVDQRLEDFDQKLAQLQDDLKPTRSDVEAFRFAIKFENGAEDFYRQQIEKTDSEPVRKFFRWLVSEEELHAKVLSSCLQFAENPTLWFLKRDRESS